MKFKLEKTIDGGKVLKAQTNNPNNQPKQGYNDMTNKVVNTGGYAYHGSNMGELAGTPNEKKRHELKVTFILDMVPGAWHHPEDLMRWIASHSYVDTVTLEG